jgi:hypothetical protein
LRKAGDRTTGALPIGPQISYSAAMATKRKKNPPLTDAERHKRFVDMAREVEASGKAKDYDKVLKKLATEKPKKR